MAIRLVDDDLDLSWTLAIDWETRQALSIQLQRCLCPSGVATFEERFVATLVNILDEDLVPPTASQISYATSICRALRIPVPQEIVLFKGSMHEFLRRKVPVFKQLVAEKGPRKPASKRARNR